MSETPTQTVKKSKKYFWLKLKEGFFDNRNIKLLRAQDNGDTLVIVYLMMQCKALKSDGLIDYRQILPSIEDEIALDIGVDAEIVKAALAWLERLDLIERVDGEAVMMLARSELVEIGKEGESAERMRRYRGRKASQSDVVVTQR